MIQVRPLEIGLPPVLDAAQTDTGKPVPAGKMERWAEAALAELEKVGASYGGSITYSALRREVLGDEHTAQLLSNWSYGVLNRVIKLCEERGLPALTSLVVQETTGMVGRGFNGVIERNGIEAPESQLEREMAAAVERLKCYRVYCPDVPEDAEPRLTREYDEYRADITRKNKPERLEPAACKGCDYVLPATGICDDCN